jgi:hypothetical protein
LLTRRGAISGIVLKWLRWTPVEGVYDRIEIAGRAYDLAPGMENQIAALIREFPTEEPGKIFVLFRKRKTRYGFRFSSLNTL